MRAARHTTLSFAIVVAAAACTGDQGPDLAEEPEVPRGDYHLLIQRYPPSGMRSWYSMSPTGAFAAPFPAPADARWLIPSPDGKSIAYLRDYDDLVHLWIMDRDGDSRRPVLADETVIAHASWSPDGTRLVIERSTLEITSDIMIVNRDGTGLVNLTPDASPAIVFDRTPAWSPDGARIAFTSNRNGVTKLWIMDANGANQRQVVAEEGIEQSPVWSSDGTRIAFRALTSNGPGFGVVRPDGSGYQFVPVAGDGGRIAWLPDGRVLYSTNATGNYEIYAHDLATGTATNLTRSADHDYSAVVVKHTMLDPWLGFEAARSYTGARADPAGVAVGDVTGDGRADLVVASPAISALQILRGTAGGFELLGALDATSIQQELIVRDVTGDGHADIVLLEAGGFALWRGGTGGPGAREALTVPQQAIARGLALKERTESGIPEVVVTYDPVGEQMRMRVHGLDGDGNMIAYLEAPVEYMNAGRVCVGDVGGDGHHDYVLLTRNNPAPVLLLKGLGVVSVEPALEATSGFTLEEGAAALCADVDGDRRTDLVLLHDGTLSLLRSTGDAFAALVALTSNVAAVAAADVDRDGDVDLLASRRGNATLDFIRNLGDGTFARAVPVALPARAIHLTAAEVNGDGWTDVVAIAENGTVYILTNRRR